MKTVSVVIPVYKHTPSDDEMLSINRTVAILERYDITIICPEGMDASTYTSICKKYCVQPLVKTFHTSFFDGIEGYNRLLLSECFYKQFEEYEYILISQPDAYIFRDELQGWCDKKYDYVGAPLIGDYADASFSMKMRVGNGGLSLRKVSYYLQFFHSRKNVFTSSQIVSLIDLNKKPYTRVFVWLLMLLGWRNKPNIVAKRWKYNEDDFWSGLLDKSRYALSKPDPVEAIRFAFERFPSELYELNHHQLPFGCHAWKKYQYDSFWSEFIF